MLDPALPSAPVYAVFAAPSDAGDYIVTAPDFPELLTGDRDRDALPALAADALDECVLARLANGEEVPRPSTDVRAPAGAAVLWITLEPLTAARPTR